MAGKLAKSLPKRATNAHLKETRKRSFASGEARRALRREENQARAKSNRAAGKTPKRQTRVRPRSENVKVCDRCHIRRVVCGAVCQCEAVGAWVRPVSGGARV